METKKLLKSLKRRLGLVTAILAMLAVSQEIFAWGWAARDTKNQDLNPTVYVGSTITFSWCVNGDGNGASYKRVGISTSSSSFGTSYDPSYAKCTNCDCEGSGNNRYQYTYTATSAGTKYYSLWLGWGSSVGDNGRYYNGGGWSEGMTSCSGTSFTVKAVPAPKSCSISVTNAVSGTGTSLDPYIVRPGASYTVKVTATKADDFTGSGYAFNINTTSSKAGAGTTASYSKNYTAGTAGSSAEYTGYAWHYNGSTTYYSSEYATSSKIYVSVKAACTNPTKSQYTMASQAVNFDGNPQAPSIIVATGAGSVSKIYGSTDNGSTWTDYGTSGPTNVGVYKIKIDCNAGGTYCAANGIVLDNTFTIFSYYAVGNAFEGGFSSFHEMNDMGDGTYRIQVLHYDDKPFKITTQPCWNDPCSGSEAFYNDNNLSKGTDVGIECWLSDSWSDNKRGDSYIKNIESGYTAPVYLYINPTTKKIWAEATSTTIENLYIRGPLVDGTWPDADNPDSYHKFTKNGDTFTIKLYGSGGGDEEAGKFVLTTGVGEGYRIHNNLFKFKDCHADQKSVYNFVSDLAYDAEEGYVLTISITLVEGKYSLVVAQKTLPTVDSVTPGSRCGTGTVELSATATAGEGTVSIKWYATATDSDVLGTTASGATWTTPSISTTTTYYAEAVDDNFASKERRAVTATVKPTNLIITHEPATVNPYTRVTLTAKNQSGTETNSNWTITGAGSYFTESDNPTGVSSVVMKPAKDVETTVTATATVEGCEATGTYTVTPTPDTEVCQ